MASTPEPVGATPPRRPLAVTPAGIMGTLLLAALVVLFIRLGFWQLARLAEQREVNAGIAARLDEPPIDDPAALPDTTGLFYRSVALTGTFDHDRSIVLPGRSRGGLPGVHLLTPLRSPGQAAAVLVNRGWIPSADGATIELADFVVADSVTLTGLVLPFPGSAQSLAPARRSASDASSDAVITGAPAFRRVWFSIDEAALRRQFPYPLLPVTVQTLPDAAADAAARGGRGLGRGQAAPARGASNYPAPLPPPPLDDGPHLGYALQWFSFALIGVIGWVALALRGRGPADQQLD
jgi:surfeit locus 1 family protein